MSEVKRYTFMACDNVECANGKYVLASDYDRDTKALEDKARSQHARDSAELRDLCSQRDGLKAELWRAKEERDKLASELAELKAKMVPIGCRQRLASEGKPYPRSSCAVCGQLSPRWRECDSMLAAAPSKEDL